MGRHFKKADSAGQGYLMPPDARQWLPERHLAWALLELAGELDLAGSRPGTGPTGRAGRRMTRR